MLAAGSATATVFKEHDILLFRDQLVQEVLATLQMPASVGFWLHEPAYSQFHTFAPDQVRILAQKRQDRTPCILEGMLIIPLSTTSAAAGADVVLYDIDPGFLEKMDPEWLLELQTSLLENFGRLRRMYVDPVTGLYNQWALERVLDGTTPWKSLFLIATVSRTRSIFTGFQGIGQLASLLEVITRDPLFYLGQGVFGHLSLLCDRKAACEFSHRLIRRLKREKLRKIHVGFSCLDEEQAGKGYENCCQALFLAEQRGPFSLCDAQSLQGRRHHPLALPDKSVLQLLQQRWRGLHRFGLVLLEANPDDRDALVEAVALFPDTCFAVAADEGYYVLLPEYSAVQTADTVNSVGRRLAKHLVSPPAMGSCHWPSAAARKIDSVRNCRKAILHGSFYGTGAVVCFDALSLNVSGDLFFEEGDYKQAIREYRAGLAMKPEDINLLNSLGVALAEANRHREAMACFSRVLALKPGNHMALVNKGMSCRLLGHDDQAVQCFEWALQAKDGRGREKMEIYSQLARLYCLQGKFSSAVGLLESWREEHGTADEFLFFKLLGEAYLGTNRHREAIAALQHCLQLHPRNSDSLSMLGYLYVIEGEGVDLGLSLCERAIAMDGGEAEYFFRYAAALYHAGEDQRALSAVRDALRRKRKHLAAIALRARIYERLGAVRPAVKSYQRIVELGEQQTDHVRTALARLERLGAAV